MNENYDVLLRGWRSRPEDLKLYQQQCVWRSSNLGMKELDLAFGMWSKKNMHNLSREECEKYEREILQSESPELWKWILEDPKESGADKQPQDHYIHVVRKF